MNVYSFVLQWNPFELLIATFRLQYCWYTRRVKGAIHIRLHPNNIKRDSGIEIPEAWIPTIQKHNSRSTTKRTYEGTTSNSHNEDRNTPIAANQHAPNSDT